MKFLRAQDITKIPESDLLVLPLMQVKGKIHFPKALLSLKSIFDLPLKHEDFKGKEGEIHLEYPSKVKAKRVVMLGLGETDHVTVETLRRAFSRLAKEANRLKVKKLALYIPEVPSLSSEEILRGLLEGVLLSNYSFDQLKNEKLKKEPSSLVESICLVTQDKHAEKIASKALIIAEGVYKARDLVNGNADDVNPDYLAKCALRLAKENPKIDTKVLRKKELEAKGLGLLLAVGRGSHHEPLLIIAEYKGDPKSKEKTVLVGKGVTYDTGGLNIKPTGSMETMKCDMGGAAAVLESLEVAARLSLKANISAVIPCTENSVSATSFKPGDVYPSYLGKTVEITNTDAEGRLILADAIAYAVKNLHPTRIIDLATLTGAIEIALGAEASGLFSNNDALADSLIRAGGATFERLWRMPLFTEYRGQLKSEIADLKNHAGRSGGSITAAAFLNEFTGDVPWAHIDIAATAYLSEEKRYNPRFATGVGVRLITEFLETL